MNRPINARHDRAGAPAHYPEPGRRGWLAIQHAVNLWSSIAPRNADDPH
jgi:hypothetical protein